MGTEWGLGGRGPGQVGGAQGQHDHRHFCLQRGEKIQVESYESSCERMYNE